MKQGMRGYLGVVWGVAILGEVSLFYGKMAFLFPLDLVMPGDDA